MCGIFGIYGHPEAAAITALGLHALQHRGQESAGIVSADGRSLHARREMGLVQDVFGARELEALAGSSAIGHVRYSTAGVSQAKNAQPLTMQYAGGKVAVAHNGNLVNAQTLRARLEAAGAIFAGDSDTEAIVHLMARSRAKKLEDQVVEALRQCLGAYTLIFETPTEILGVRDAYGFRPLVLGRLRDAYVLASETTALDLVEAEYVREIEPGEMVIIDASGLRSSKPFAAARPARCDFEYVYFAKPDSVLFGRSVYGTGADFRGHAKPGSKTTLIVGAEYSLTKEWVLAFDVERDQWGQTEVTGRDSSGALVKHTSPKSWNIGFAPAVEYNWSDRAGVILGVWIVPKGHNTQSSVTPAIAIQRFW